MSTQRSKDGALKSIEEPFGPKVTYNFSEQLRLLHEAKFADFDIHCAEHTFRVHRLIICSQSPFFRALAGGDFKEANDQSTRLTDEEPSLVVRYLIYLYSDAYPESHIAQQQSPSQFSNVADEFASGEDDLKACLLHARMYCFARRRCDERLERFALQGFSRKFWSKRPQQDNNKNSFLPRGPTRTLKYHIGSYKRDGEQILIVGTKNTRAEIYDLLSDFASWSDISITQKRVQDPNFPTTYRASRSRDTVWQDSTINLSDFDFDNQHLVVGRTPNSNSKNLSLLTCVDRWQARFVSKEEQLLIRFILSETTEHGSALKDMVSLDLLMRKHSGCLIPDPTYRALQLEHPEFFLSIDALVKPQESRQCQSCFSIQPVIRQACSCGRWSDACENDCLSKQVDELKCYCCHETGTMRPLEDKPSSSRLPRVEDFPPPQNFGPVFIDDGLGDY